MRPTRIKGEYMKKILPQLLHMMLIAFIISIAQSAEAQTEDSDTRYSFVVWTNSGETFSYPLSERPKVTQTTSSLVLTTTQTEVEYPKDDVWKFTLCTGMEGGVGSITCDNIGMVQRDNVVHLTNCRAGSEVRIYSISGTLFSSQVAAEDGTLEIGLGNLNSGVYIISTESIAYKIIKR